VDGTERTAQHRQPSSQRSASTHSGGPPSLLSAPATHRCVHPSSTLSSYRESCTVPGIHSMQPEAPLSWPTSTAVSTIWDAAHREQLRTPEPQHRITQRRKVRFCRSSSRAGIERKVMVAFYVYVLLTISRENRTLIHSRTPKCPYLQHTPRHHTTHILSPPLSLSSNSSSPSSLLRRYYFCSGPAQRTVSEAGG
jgi:hypothetical protein